MLTQFTRQQCKIRNLEIRTTKEYTLIVKPDSFDLVREEGFLISNTLFPHIAFAVEEKGTVENRYLAKFKDKSFPNSTWEQCVVDSTLGDWFIIQAPLWFWAKIYKLDHIEKMNFESNRNRSVTLLWIALNS